MRSKVKEAALELGLDLELKTLDGSTATVAQAATALGVEAGQIAKSIVFVMDGEPVLVVASGRHRIDMERVCDALDCAEGRQASPDEVRRRLDAGEWVIDLRDRIAFAAGFLPGCVSFPLEGSFASYVGWTVPWGAPLTLLGETPEQVAQAQRELARIWAERPAAAASGGPARWAAGTQLASLRLAKFGDLAAAMTAGSPAVLDVRRPLEWAEGHIAGARHIPLHELADRSAELPAGELWVHCQSGYRAMTAASLLAARGREVIAVDDDLGNAAAAGLPLRPA